MVKKKTKSRSSSPTKRKKKEAVEEPSLPAEAEELSGPVIEVLDPEDKVVEKKPKAKKPPADSREVVRYDPLAAYFREIREHKPLSREEEHEIAVRYHQDKDIEAAYTLVKTNLWLVVKIAKDYEQAARNLLDLIQEGNIGLMEAVKKFDPYRGVRFPSYAVWWIRAYILRYLVANWRMVKIGTTQAQRKLFFNLKKEKEKLEREGFQVGPKLLAERLNVKESEVVEMEQRLSASDLSVDAPLRKDGEDPFLSVLPAGDVTGEEFVLKKELRELIMSSFDEFNKTLNSKEKVIFEERMLAEERATLQDLSEKLSISRERVRQIESRIQSKLKEFLSEKFGAELEALDL